MKSKILLAIDGSEPSMRAVRYVANLLGNQPDVSITLLHILLPIPPSLLEAGSFEVEPQLELERVNWVKAEETVECNIFDPVREMLTNAGFDSKQIQTRCQRLTSQSDVAHEILRESEEGSFDTIVMGKRGGSRIATFLTGSITEKIVRHAKGRAVWIID